MKSAKTMLRVVPGIPLAALLAALALAGCGGGPSTSAPAPTGADKSTAVEVVNGQPISGNMLKAFAKGRRNLDITNPALRDRALAQLADFMLLEQAAKKAGDLDHPDMVAAAEVGRLQGVWLAMMEKFADPAQVEESKVRAEYDKEYKGAGAQDYDFDQMVFADKAAATKAIAEVTGKKTFEQVMQMHRADARFARNFPKMRSTRLPADIATALASLKPDELTKTPVQVPQGWAVLHLRSAAAVTPPPYDQVKDNIRRTLARHEADARLKALRADAKITRDGVVVKPDAKPATAPPMRMMKPVTTPRPPLAPQPVTPSKP